MWPYRYLLDENLGAVLQLPNAVYAAVPLGPNDLAPSASDSDTQPMATPD